MLLQIALLLVAARFVDARMLAPLRKSTALRLLRHLADGRNSDKMSLDIGGTLAKVLVFQPTLEPPTDSQPPPLDLGEVPNDPAFRDIDQQTLSVYSPELGGNLHFFVFETRAMPEVISFVRRHFSEASAKPNRQLNNYRIVAITQKHIARTSPAFSLLCAGGERPGLGG